MAEEELILRVMQAQQRKVDRMRLEAQAALEAKREVVDAVRFSTVDSFTSTGKTYLTTRVAQDLGKLASKLCRERGIEIGKEPRKVYVPSIRAYRDTEIGIYPIQILVEAADQMGIEYDRSFALVVSKHSHPGN